MGFGVGHIGKKWYLWARNSANFKQNNSKTVKQIISKMAKSKLRLDTRRALKDGTYPVQICVGYGTNLYIATGIFLHADEWDTATCLCVGKSARKINNVLSALLLQVANRILELRQTGMWQKLTVPQIREMLENLDLSAPTVGVPTLGSMFDKVISTKKGATGTLFAQTLKKVNEFCTDAHAVRFESITKMWITDFYNSMGTLQVNSRAMHLRNLRNVINYAVDEGITTNYPFRNYKIPHEETAMRVLPVEKFRQLLNLKLDKTNAEYRDVFVLLFYLIGINMVDLGNLTDANIVNGRLEYKRAKTGKFYSIKIEVEAWEIINRYRGKKHLLACFDRYNSYKEYAAHFNDALRKIGVPDTDENGKPKYTANHLPVMVPLEKTITSYWARYSWATYAADLDVPKDTISECLGHKYGSNITGVYIKFSRDKIDAANRKVIDYLLQK